MQEGKIYVQDEASQLVASLIDIPDGSRSLDLCAAPGGKTGMVALGTRTAKNIFIASDVSRKRMTTLRQNLTLQAAERVMLVQLDGIGGIPFAHASFDRIVVDAPCTGTGTIRHNPEIRYRLLPESPVRHKRKQLKLLEHSSKLLREGGRLFYSTCSLEPEENEEVCREFLAANGSFELVVPEKAPTQLISGKCLRTWPHRDNMDGFFLAVFRRR
jgi:16S rRNA (cytosine967-C5)-methyltransferase